MKRPRNVDCGKIRRPLKRSKITDGIYGSTFLYLRFLLVWALVLMADFILEFRFEYLWPFWLLLRSVYDSFKYQGLAFSVFFVCIAITSDVICYLLYLYSGCSLQPVLMCGCSMFGIQREAFVFQLFLYGCCLFISKPPYVLES
ncbi:Macoilin-2 [Bulinus truncatus]|nr:Macoilin-2 [Bulinus truncatus]